MKLHAAVLTIDEAIAALRATITPPAEKRTQIADKLSRYRDHLRGIDRDMADRKSGIVREKPTRRRGEFGAVIWEETRRGK